MEPGASPSTDPTSAKADITETPSVDALVELLIQAARQTPRVLGTHLGSAIKAKFPTFDIRTQFGGLRRFIAAHCADQINWIEKRGGDDVYAHVTMASRATFSPSGVATSSAPTSAWAAFTNPNYSQVLAVDQGDGDLTVVSPVDAVPSKAVLVPKATSEEHRSIARDFVSEIPAESRVPFEHALSQPNYWPAWQQALQTLRGTPYYTNWLRARSEKLTTLFRERLATLEVPEEATNVAAAQLQQSRSAARQMSLAVARPSSQTGPVPPAAADALQRPASNLLREVAMSSIGRMADDDLRRLWLPLGAVIDALRGQR